MIGRLRAVSANGLNAEMAIRLTRWLLVGVACVATAAVGARLAAPVDLEFPDFPMGIASIDLGQSLTVKVDAQHDGGQGVRWSCDGDACGQLTSTTKWATFYATGITGTATITATSIKRPSMHKSLKLTVFLNAVPDMLCDTPVPQGDPRPSIEGVVPYRIDTFSIMA
jgi:hypothetical protein